MLHAIVLLPEKDCNNDVLWAWTYPSVTNEQKSLILRKCSFDLGHPFLYGRYRSHWFYINCTEVFESDNLPGVKQFALVLWSRDFNPEKYETLCRILSKSYCKTGNPVMLLKLILSVMTRGACTTEENGTYFTKDFERNALQNNVTMLKELIKLFELQTIIIYTALLLKKRLVIYHHSLPQLLKWVRTFPALMAHRPEAENLYPWVDLCNDELDQITNSQSSIVGCGDSRILSRVDLFDVLVNLPAREITIAPHAKESMTMTKAHKEIALFLVQLADREGITEAQIVREVADKTQDLLSHLRSLATESTNGENKAVSMESLRVKKFSPAVENFLLQLALAENLLV
ncbi:putative DENN domain-containing protein 10 B isoform X2 [Macrosteles quadrilineatus]|uniref:putative DENN domain-containing protein 10 B isoform X2 n=1 Tax=Macrosteles quadrilineatus TaxID=74068 RepID=UPI0023E0DEC8|nr:putative DENN domain-containing protein 10 B isoform X2 [Macrosteles quadrilineatus]